MSFYLIEDTDCYVWEINAEHYFKNCDANNLIISSINRYIKICSNTDLHEILNRKYFPRVNCYKFKKQSRIKIQKLTFDKIHNIHYQKLLASEQFANILMCEFYVGPYWHFLGIHQEMFKNRKLHHGRLSQNCYIIGYVLYGRDRYYGENETHIQESEKSKNIVIIRN